MIKFGEKTIAKIAHALLSQLRFNRAIYSEKVNALMFSKIDGKECVVYLTRLSSSSMIKNLRLQLTLEVDGKVRTKRTFYNSNTDRAIINTIKSFFTRLASYGAADYPDEDDQMISFLRKALVDYEPKDEIFVDVEKFCPAELFQNYPAQFELIFNKDNYIGYMCNELGEVSVVRCVNGKTRAESYCENNSYGFEFGQFSRAIKFIEESAVRLSSRGFCFDNVDIINSTHEFPWFVRTEQIDLNKILEK